MRQGQLYCDGRGLNRGRRRCTFMGLERGPMRRLFIIALLLVTPTTRSVAQDIYVAPLTLGADAIKVGEFVNATNRPGYDSQPCFSPDSKSLLYSAIDDNQATDIWMYIVGSTGRIQITKTSPESEYSPTWLDNEFFSTVRVEADSTQRLWKMGVDGSAAEVLLPKVTSIGYHAWLDEHRLVLFIVGDPHTLQFADTRTGAAKVISDGIGRSMHRIPETNHASVFLTTEAGANIMAFDPDKEALTPLCDPVGEGEDYAWTPDGRLVMSDGAKLWSRTPDTEWQQVTGFEGFADAGRIAISPNGKWIAIVASDETPAQETE